MPADSEHLIESPTPPRAGLGAMLAAFAIVVIVGAGLRLGTHAATMPATYDEPWITVPIINLIEQGWSMRTAVDFDETKGPGLIWPYAIVGKAIGTSIGQLRLISVGFFILGALPLLDIARRCGMAGGALPLVAVFYALLPYNATLGQLVMSEPSFAAMSLAACWLFVVGMETRSRAGRIATPALFAVTLTILLHNRVHAAALAPAVCLTVFARGGIRGAMPWAIACAIAALARVPLLVHWGGIVSPRFQGLHSMGVRLEGMTYLLAALAPALALFIPAALAGEGPRLRRILVAVGAVVGLAFSLIAMPSLQETAISAGVTQNVYSGVVATFARILTAEAGWQSVIIGALAVIGGASLAALGCVAWRQNIRTTLGLVHRLQFWTLFTGWGMYVASAAPAYDRYVLGWIMLLPIVWCTELPRPLRLLQGLILAGMAANLASRWLM